MDLETHEGLHSALCFPVPGGLATPLKSAAGATLRVITAPVRAPLRPTASLAQEVPGGHHKNLISAGSLLSFLSLTFGLVACIPGPIQTASLLGNHTGFGIWLLPKMLSHFTPLSHAPAPSAHCKVMP